MLDGTLQVTCGFVTIILGAIVYFISRKTWYMTIANITERIKYYYFGILYCLDDQINARHNKTDLPSMPDKVAIITGGSRGVGGGVVKKLLQCDMEVIIACRTTDMGEDFVREIRESGITSGRTKVYKLDNCCCESVREFAKQIKRDYSKIDILVNNAAVMFVPTYAETADGFEEQWMVNYLSHFLLTSLLLPLLKAAGDSGNCSRIINVTSCVHHIATIDFNSITNCSNETYLPYQAYGQSKLAQTMFTVTLQDLLKDKSLNVLVYSVHPGIVRTDLFKHTLLGQHKWLTIAWKTPEQGATPVVYAAVNKDIEKKGGMHISNCKEAAMPQLALDKEIQKQLFEISLKQVQLNNFFQYL